MDRKTGGAHAHQLNCKGSDDSWIATRIVADIEEFGYGESRVILKANQEVAIANVQRQVGAVRSGETLPTNPGRASDSVILLLLKKKCDVPLGVWMEQIFFLEWHDELAIHGNRGTSIFAKVESRLDFLQCGHIAMGVPELEYSVELVSLLCQQCRHEHYQI